MWKEIGISIEKVDIVEGGISIKIVAISSYEATVMEDMKIYATTRL